MAVGIRIKLAGINQEQFDLAHDHINPDRVVPNGLLFHSSGPIDGGWGVLDVWHSRNAFDQFAASKLTAAARRNGMRNLREDGWFKIRDGVTTTEEVTRVTQEF